MIVQNDPMVQLPAELLKDVLHHRQQKRFDSVVLQQPAFLVGCACNKIGRIIQKQMRWRMRVTIEHR